MWQSNSCNYRTQLGLGLHRHLLHPGPASFAPHGTAGPGSVAGPSGCTCMCTSSAVSSSINLASASTSQVAISEGAEVGPPVSAAVHLKAPEGKMAALLCSAGLLLPSLFIVLILQAFKLNSAYISCLWAIKHEIFIKNTSLLSCQLSVCLLLNNKKKQKEKIGFV